MTKIISPLAKNQFLQESLRSMPRLLGQIDRNIGTLTYGSFDRNHWLSKTADVSNARNQEAIYTLTLLFCQQFEGNIYYKNSKIMEWIIASLRFIESIQKNDGSFDEYYQNESSFVCTSFVTVAVAQSYDLISKLNILQNKEKKIYKNILSKSSSWLSKNLDDEVSNQLAGSALALSLSGKILNNKDYKILAQDRLNLLLSRQNDEGWWSEYGGPDIGYLSVTIDYLAKYRNLNNDTSFDESIKKAINFIINFIHPDFSAGGCYGSRNTEYLIPSGFSILQNDFDEAGLILNIIAQGINNTHGFSPLILDDRYLCNILYNWVEAGLNYHERKEVDLWNRKINISYEKSGIRVFQNENFYFVTNLNKGGSFCLHTKNNKYHDSGLLIEANNKNYTTGNLTNHSQDMKNLISSGRASVIKTHTMSGLKALLFKTWQYVFGKIPFVQRSTRSVLRKILITDSTKTSIKFTRSFHLSSNELIVKDIIKSPLKNQKISFNKKASYNAVVSSKYFSVNDLLNDELIPIKSEEINDDGHNFKRIFKL